MEGPVNCKIGDLFAFEYGKSLTKKERKETGSYPVYGSNGIVGFHDEYLVEGPAIIIGRKGAVGEVEFETNNLWPIDTTYYVKVAEYLDFKYSYFLLKSLVLSRLDKSTAIPGLNRNDAYDLNVDLPPLPEQRAIVSRIEQLFSDLDNGIANLRLAQEQLKVYRQAVLKKAFEGELTRKWREHQTDLPDNWHWVKVDSILEDSKKGMKTGPFGTALKKHEHQASGIPVYGIENIGEGVFRMPNKIFITEMKFHELEAFKVQPNDVIISRSGTVGEICAIPEKTKEGIISTNLMRIRLNSNLISTKYFVYLFQGGNVREQVKELCKGSTRVFLNQTILSSINFPLCSLPEQHAIVQQIETRLSVCDKLEQDIAENLEKAEALRQSILKKAFEGKLLNERELEEVRRAPDWESAEKLLERIKAQKKNKSEGV
ncbi:MAG: type restriction enzyme subunit [Methanolobus sp.]|jgi:type I restriction enzyme S subunit|nr:type restriction enzyme subunit [Methanolobus sp.]